MAKIKKKHAGGRPTKMTPEVLGKLEDAYLSDATHLQAAIFAGINESTLHDWRKANPEFSKRIDALKGMTGLRAKNNVSKAITREGEVELDDNGNQKSKGTGKSMWWLERRDPDFKPKKVTDLNIGLQEDFLKSLREEGKG